jgi:hypothetical protein
VNHTSNNYSKLTGGARLVLSQTTLNVSALLAQAEPSVVTRGRAYYKQFWRCKLESLATREAMVRVQGSSRYTVYISLEDDGEIEMLCDCPYADEAVEIICKHKVAAALFLHDQLRFQKPPTWESILEKAIKAGERNKKIGRDSLLFFSLQARGAASCLIVPYMLSDEFFLAHVLKDKSEVSRIVVQNRLGTRAEKIEAYGSDYNKHNFLNVTAREVSLVRVVFASGVSYGGMYGGAGLDFSALAGLLKGAPLFFGTPQNPLQRRIEVADETARVELEMSADADEIRLQPVYVLPDARAVRFSDKRAQIINRYPLWILCDEMLCPVDATDEAFDTFKDAGSLSIPRAEEAAFYEKHLTRIAEAFPLRGDDLKWETAEDTTPIAQALLDGRDKRIARTFALELRQV